MNLWLNESLSQGEMLDEKGKSKTRHEKKSILIGET